MSISNTDSLYVILRKRLWYDKETGIFRWRFHTKTGKNIPWSIAGCTQSRGYVHIKIGSVGYKAHRLAWLYVYGTFPENEIDHINGIKDDNRIKNLRSADRIINTQNRHKVLSKTAGVLGVSWHKASNLWVAQISINNKKIHLGTFKTKELASEKYNFIKNSFLQDYIDNPGMIFPQNLKECMARYESTIL